MPASRPLVVVRHRLVRAVGVLRVLARDGPQDQRAVPDRLAEHPHVVGAEAAVTGHVPEPADTSVGGLEPHHAAKRSRIPHRAAVIRAQRAQAQARGQARRRPATGSPGNPLRVPGVARGAVERVDGRTPVGPLVHVGLAQDHRPRLPQPRHHRGVEIGNAVLQHLGARGGADAARRDVVLDGQRNAVERPAVLALAYLGLRRPGVLQRLVPRHRDVGHQFWIQPLDPRQHELGQLNRGQLPALDCRCRVPDCKLSQITFRHHGIPPDSRSRRSPACVRGSLVARGCGIKGAALPGRVFLFDGGAPRPWQIEIPSTNLLLLL